MILWRSGLFYFLLASPAELFLKHLDKHALKFVSTLVPSGTEGEVALVSSLVALPLTVGHRRSQSADRGMASKCLRISLRITQLLA